MLPPIGKTYYTSINIPLIGTQNVKYERTKKLISEVFDQKERLLLN